MKYVNGISFLMMITVSILSCTEILSILENLDEAGIGVAKEIRTLVQKRKETLKWGDTLIAPTITDYGLEFAYLYARETTDLIVIHHTGNPTNDDMSAEQIHASHIYNNGWSGIGYHYVVRKNGDIEFGRPEWAIGSHAYGENSHSIGIHVCGNFELAEPTPAQIESTSYLIGWLCDKYGLVPTE